MTRRFSLSARLVASFVLLMTLCLLIVGTLLFRAVSNRFFIQDETNLVLAMGHLKRMTVQMASVSDLIAQKPRLISAVMGDDAVAMRMTDERGRVLVEYDPSGYAIQVLDALPPTEPVARKAVISWYDRDGMPFRGLAVVSVLRDGTRIDVTVIRMLADRKLVLDRYRWDVVLILLVGGLLSALLSYFLVHRAMRSLRTMADDAQVINAQRLGTRLSMDDKPLELHALVQSLNAMLARLEQGFERVWQFTVDLAHDLRTPVANLRGANEVALVRDRSIADYHALLESNIEECDRVSRTIENVLFLARAENPQFTLQRLVFDAARELVRIADYFEGVAEEADVTIAVEGEATVGADRELFRRAVSNLLSNALRYAPRGSVIGMSAYRIEGRIEVSVANEGTGIDAAHLEKIFDRFYRIDRSRSDSPTSTGLGLSIVKSIMELHGGSVSVVSNRGKTTRFTLVFPDHPPPPVGGG